MGMREITDEPRQKPAPRQQVVQQEDKRLPSFFGGKKTTSIKSKVDAALADVLVQDIVNAFRGKAITPFV